MSRPAYRFLHASDLHLDQPIYGISSAPTHLRDLLLDAPLKAAERVFDSAVGERVDFVVLSGGVCGLRRPDPRVLLFLRDQFKRLEERGITVYWVGGQEDNPADWPDTLPLPENVITFPTDRFEWDTHERDDEPLVTIVGRSRAGSKTLGKKDLPDDTDCPVIVVGPGDWSTASRDLPVDYWALGGENDRRTVSNTNTPAIYPGSPQGRCPEETGPHGCTLVRVDDRGTIRPQFIPLDILRWHTENITLPEATEAAIVRKMLRDRMRTMVSAAPDRNLLIEFRITAGPVAAAALARDRVATKLSEELREEFGRRDPAAWTLSIEVEPPDHLPQSWREEDTIFGDYLRTVGQQERRSATSLNLQTMIPEKHATSPIADAVLMTEDDEKDVVVRKAAMLGVELLQPSAADDAPTL